MKEPHSEGVANHADLESCAGGREAVREALTEALAGWVWEQPGTGPLGTMDYWGTKPELICG